jgi:hypothetical protein
MADDDIARAVLHGGGPPKMRDDDKDYLLQSPLCPSWNSSAWPSDTMPGGKVRRITLYCFDEYP